MGPVRASRLVSLLLLLQARGRMTATALATELDVSVRTVYRDVDALHAAGVPLYGDAGPDGGYRLLEGYRTRLTGLTADEAEALFLAGLPGPAAELGLGSVVAAAQLKLMAALPAELRDRAGRISARFHLDAPGWYHDPEQTPYLAAVAAAVWTGSVIRVRYHRWRSPQDVTRTLRPYGLVLKAGRWYAVAERDGRLATYRIAAILDLQPLAERFERPADFDLAAYWADYLAEFATRRHAADATVRLRTAVLPRLPDLWWPEVARAATDSARPDGAGWVRSTIPIESVEHAVGELLRLGTDVEAIDPPELRAALRTTLADLADTYSS